MRVEPQEIRWVTRQEDPLREPPQLVSNIEQIQQPLPLLPPIRINELVENPAQTGQKPLLEIVQNTKVEHLRKGKAIIINSDGRTKKEYCIKHLFSGTTSSNKEEDDTVHSIITGSNPCKLSDPPILPRGEALSNLSDSTFPLWRAGNKSFRIIILLTPLLHQTQQVHPIPNTYPSRGTTPLTPLIRCPPVSQPPNSQTSPMPSRTGIFSITC